MLAMILKSRKATSTTFAIIETFAKVRNLKRELVELHKESDSHRRSAKRALAKINYRIHTDAIKEELIPAAA